jgi:methionyl-tRNA formyltransferase
MKRRVILLGKGTLVIRIANWFLEHPHYELRTVVPVIPEPTWTDSDSCWVTLSS